MKHASPYVPGSSLMIADVDAPGSAPFGPPTNVDVPSAAMSVLDTAAVNWSKVTPSPSFTNWTWWPSLPVFFTVTST